MNETQAPLRPRERAGIVTSVESTFAKLRNLYTQIAPTFVDFGFDPPSPGVLARDVSEKIERAIVQHCPTFTRGRQHVDLCRDDFDWEVKIRLESGMTINGCKVVAGETYVFVNYTKAIEVKKISVLWRADETMFSARNVKAQARSLSLRRAQGHVEVLLTTSTRRPPTLVDAYGLFGDIQR